VAAGRLRLPLLRRFRRRANRSIQPLMISERERNCSRNLDRQTDGITMRIAIRKRIALN
jgi:predicted ATPase